jgi:hypothetical protein
MAKKQAAQATSQPESLESQIADRKAGIKPPVPVEVVSEVPKQDEPKISVTERLFPESVKKEAPSNTDKIKSELVEEKKEEVIPAEPVESEEYFLEDILEKHKIPLDKLKSRIKVDEKEEVVSFDEFKKRVQLKSHFDNVAQDIGRQRRELAEERKRMQNSEPVKIDRNPRTEVPTDNPDNFIGQLLNRINALEARAEQLNPVVFETNRNKVANELKAEGFSDFLDYLPAIEEHISKISDPAMQEHYDTIEGAKELFFRLKAREGIANKSVPAKQPVPEVKVRPELPVIKMDSGQQPSSLSSDDIDDATSKYNQLLSRWKETRSSEDLYKLMRFQKAIS